MQMLLPSRNTENSTWTSSENSGVQSVILRIGECRASHPDAPVEELEKLATERVVSKQKKSRAFYRIQVYLSQMFTLKLL